MRTCTGMALAAVLAGGVVVAGAAPAGATSSGIISTVAGGPGHGVGTNVSQVPVGVAAAPGGSVYVGDLGGVVRALNDGSSYEGVTAGVGVGGFSGDRRYAGRAQLSQIQGVAAGPDGNVFAADTGNDRIRMVAGATGDFYGVRAVRGDIYTIAGDGNNGYAGDGGPAVSAELAGPQGLAVDAAGNVLIADSANSRIRMVAATTGTFYGQAMKAGDIYTVAGDGHTGFSGDGGPATAAEIWAPSGVAVDGSGNLVIADTINDRIRVVAATTGTFYGQAMTVGDIYTVAGSGLEGFAGDGGPATSARMGFPMGVTVDPAGNLVIADTGNDRLRVVAESTRTFYGQAMTAGDMYTIAGNGGDGVTGQGGPATSASLGAPRSVTVDSSGNVVTATWDIDRVRVVATSTGSFYGQAMTAGDLYTVGGNGQVSLSGNNGGALSAELDGPAGVAVDASGDCAIMDHNEVRFVPASAGTFFGRSLNPGRIYAIAGTGHAGYSGDGGPAKAATLRSPGGVAFDSAGNLVIADGGNNAVRVVAASTGTFYGRAMNVGDIYTVAGTGTRGSTGNGGPATSAELNGPVAVTADGGGNIAIADAGNDQVRLVAESTGTFYGQAMTAGDIYAVAGTGTPGDTGDGGPGTAATLNQPGGVTTDANGNLVIADTRNSAVRVVAAATGTFYDQAMTAGGIYRVAGTGSAGDSGDGGPAAGAQVNEPSGVAADGAGNLVIADTQNDAVRVVAGSTGTFYGQAMTAGDIYTVAGTGQPGFSGDGGAATGAQMDAPAAVSVDPAGDIVVADTGNNRIREIGR